MAAVEFTKISSLFFIYALPKVEKSNIISVKQYIEIYGVIRYEKSC